MKFLQNKEISKKIIIAILLVMSFNFISPTVSDADIGGTLFKPISELLSTIADLVIEGLQYYFMGDGDITPDPKEYNIRYSPALIFSNKVAGLDVNFFEPGIYTQVTIKEEETRLIGLSSTEQSGILDEKNIAQILLELGIIKNSAKDEYEGKIDEYAEKLEKKETVNIGSYKILVEELSNNYVHLCSYHIYKDKELIGSITADVWNGEVKEKSKEAVNYLVEQISKDKYIEENKEIINNYIERLKKGTAELSNGDILTVESKSIQGGRIHISNTIA